jgi:hypothetical protein
MFGMMRANAGLNRRRSQPDAFSNAGALPPKFRNIDQHSSQDHGIFHRIVPRNRGIACDEKINGRPNAREMWPNNVTKLNQPFGLKLGKR